MHTKHFENYCTTRQNEEYVQCMRRYLVILIDAGLRCKDVTSSGFTSSLSFSAAAQALAVGELPPSAVVIFSPHKPECSHRRRHSLMSSVTHMSWIMGQGIDEGHSPRLSSTRARIRMPMRMHMRIRSSSTLLPQRSSSLHPIKGS